MKLKRFGNLVTDEVSPQLSELLQSFAQETGQITYTDIYNYKGSAEKNKKLIYHINKWNEYIESGQDDKALKKSDEIRQMVKGQKEFSGDYTKIYLILDKKSSNLLVYVAFDSVKDVQEYAKKEIGEMTEYKIKPIRLYHGLDKSSSNGQKEFSNSNHGSKSAEELLGKELAWDLMQLAWDSGKYGYSDIDRFCDKVENDTTIDLKGLKKLVRNTKDASGKEFTSNIHKIVEFLKSPTSNIKSFSGNKSLLASDNHSMVNTELSSKREFSRTDLTEVSFKTSNPKRLTEIVKAIGEIGNPGHYFTIVLDPNSDSKTEFTWDGDGSDYIELDSIKSFSEREQVPQYIADEVDANGVVVKYKGDWRIVSKKQKPYEFWDAKYKTKQDAEDALAAYHANK